MTAGTGTVAVPRTSLARIRELYVDERRSLREIAEMTGHCTDTITRRLDLLGIERRHRPGTSTLSNAELAELYREAGYTLEQLAERAGVSRETVRRRLRAAGVRRRPHGPRVGLNQRVAPADLERTVELHRVHGTTKTAQILGLHETSVRDRLHAAGVRLQSRPPGRGLVTLAEYSARTGVSTATAQRRCAAGSVPDARRETTWPYRWLIPTAAIPNHQQETTR